MVNRQEPDPPIIKSRSLNEKMSCLLVRVGCVAKRYRLEKGMTPTELASDIGITVSHLVKIEEGAVDANLQTLEKLSNCLNIDLLTLIQDTEALSE